MGLPMAQQIRRAGFPLVVYNRTKEKATPLLEEGATWASSPQVVAEVSDIVISMVADDAALQEVVGGEKGILQANQLPSIHISMSTVSPSLIEHLTKEHSRKGITLLAAPVSGRPERAQQGRLWIFLSGEPEAKRVAAPLLATMSEKVFDLGDTPTRAALFKLSNNFMILSLIEMFAEAGAMLEKKGISMQTAAEIWGSSLFDAPIFHTYAPLICKQDFSGGGFTLALGLKDMRLLHHSADQEKVPMPFLNHLHDQLLTSMNLGREELDWSAISLLAKERAGLA
jgi:3-hydroxyisobutyrate dehydrogenase-like beta-hydroxyacid dehydrogenase